MKALLTFFSLTLLASAQAQLQSVTFSVDMAEQIVSADGVHLAGSFSDAGLPEWQPNGIAMSDANADGVFEVTLGLLEGSTYSYKFLNGNAWGQDEQVPAECTLNGDRTVEVPNESSSIPTVCFASCSACPPPNPGCTDSAAQNFDPAAISDDGSCTYLLTLQVDMTFEQPIAAAGVHVIGDFNAYDPMATQLSDQGNDIYTVTIVVQQGTYQAFKFLNGNTFDDQELVPAACGIEDGFGAYKREIQMPAADLVLDAVCFSACEGCGNLTGGCTDSNAVNYHAPAHVDDNSCLYEVAFMLDLSLYTDPFTTVSVVGSFNGFDASALQMDDSDGDFIYSATANILAGNYNFLYTFDDYSVSESFDGSESCTSFDGSFFTRSLVVADEVFYGPTCWNSCDACPLDEVEVTFRVDMANETISENGVHLAGSFNNWNPAALEMTPVLYGVYEATVLLNANSFYEYKFINGNDFNSDEDVPIGCEINWNRFLFTSVMSETLEVVCFGECEACAGCTDPFSINFNPLAESDDGSCFGVANMGCTYEDADNYDLTATLDDGSCSFQNLTSDCASDLNGDGEVDSADLVIFLGAFGSVCSVD